MNYFVKNRQLTWHSVSLVTFKNVTLRERDKREIYIFSQLSMMGKIALRFEWQKERRRQKQENINVAMGMEPDCQIFLQQLIPFFWQSSDKKQYHSLLSRTRPTYVLVLSPVHKISVKTTIYDCTQSNIEQWHQEQVSIEFSNHYQCLHYPNCSITKMFHFVN